MLLHLPQVALEIALEIAFGGYDARRRSKDRRRLCRYRSTGKFGSFVSLKMEKRAKIPVIDPETCRFADIRLSAKGDTHARSLQHRQIVSPVTNRHRQRLINPECGAERVESNAFRIPSQDWLTDGTGKIAIGNV